MASPRTDYLSWDDYFMAVAFLAAKRSKDPSTQVGACIVNEEKKIVGVGYNGMPNGCSDSDMPWAREGDLLETKYPYVCHAEMNAILNKNSSDVKNCRIFVALFPCNECAKLIIQSGIREVIYLSDKYHDQAPFIASRRLLEMAGVKCTKFTPKSNRISIDFDEISQLDEPKRGASRAPAEQEASGEDEEEEDETERFGFGAQAEESELMTPSTLSNSAASRSPLTPGPPAAPMPPSAAVTVPEGQAPKGVVLPTGEPKKEDEGCAVM